MSNNTDNTADPVEDGSLQLITREIPTSRPTYVAELVPAGETVQVIKRDVMFWGHVINEGASEYLPVVVSQRGLTPLWTVGQENSPFLGLGYLDVPDEPWEIPTNLHEVDWAQGLENDEAAYLHPDQLVGISSNDGSDDDDDDDLDEEYRARLAHFQDDDDDDDDDADDGYHAQALQETMGIASDAEAIRQTTQRL